MCNSSSELCSQTEETTPTQDSTVDSRRWNLDFTDDTTNVSAPPQPQRSQTIRAAIDQYMHPPGFPKAFSARDSTPFIRDGSHMTSPASLTESSSKRSGPRINDEERQSSAFMQRAYNHSWNVAFSPIRALCTSWFALYVTGDRLNAFSLVTTVTVFFMQVRSLLATREAFRPVFKSYPFSVVSLLPQIMIHGVVICIGISYALFKANVLGFLPTTESDWIALLPLHTVAPMTFRHAPLM